MKLSELLFSALIYVLMEDDLVVSRQLEPVPAVGDIYLMPGDRQGGSTGLNRVQVYLPQSLEGLPYQWGDICMEGSGDALSIGTVICRQFGYTSGKLTAPPANLPKSKTHQKASRATTDVSIWLHGLDCGPPPPSIHHILRCKYRNVTTDGSGCTPAYVNCTKSDRLTAHPYQGQAYLCPPQDFNKQNRSTSTGLVLLYHHHSWGTISYKVPIASGIYELDTLCRQLGFTRNIFQSGLPLYNYSHCYQADGIDPSLPYATGVWLTADHFDCGGSKACSGCCYRYPLATSDVVPMKQADLQLSCTFDPETSVQYTEGNSSLCSFNDTKDFAKLKSSACAVKDEPSKNNIMKIIGYTLGAVTLISLLLALAGCIGYVRVKWRLRGHGEGQPLLQGQQAQNNNDAGN